MLNKNNCILHNNPINLSMNIQNREYIILIINMIQRNLPQSNYLYKFKLEVNVSEQVYFRSITVIVYTNYKIE